MSSPSHARGERAEVFLRLLDGFQLSCNGETVSVPLRDRPIDVCVGAARN
jgi:hypothetical protein